MEADLAIKMLRDKGLTYRQIADGMNVSQRRVAQVMQGNRPSMGRGRPSQLTAEIRAFVETNWLADARITDPQMRSMVNEKFETTFTRRTITIWRNTFRILYRPPLRVQILTEEQKNYSYQWAMDMIRWMIAEENAGRRVVIVFSDESRFCLDCDRRWVRYRRGEWNETAFRLMTKFPLGVMVWGAIGPGYKSPLIRCSAGVGSAEYLEILRLSKMVEDCDARYGHRQWCFQQDGAPAHRAGLTLTSLYEAVNVLPGWPANRCDLNPIEMLWGVLGSRLPRDRLQTPDDLFSALERLWEDLDFSVTDRLVASFPSRLDMAVQVRGNTISQLLSSHMAPRPQDVRIGDVPVFSAMDDARLTDAVDTMGHRWTQIVDEVRFSSPRSPLELRVRYEFLEAQERNRLAMMLERECVLVAQPLDGVIELCFPPQKGEAAAATIVVASSSGSSEDEDDGSRPPRFVKSEAGFLRFCGARRAELLARGVRKPLPLFVRELKTEWLGLSAQDRARWALAPPHEPPGTTGARRARQPPGPRARGKRRV
jgi:transcriptional regulator with XRE-family HTH domain